MTSDQNTLDVSTTNFSDDSAHTLNLESVSSDLTDLLDKRLEGWLAMVRSLTDYFREVADGEETISKRLTKTSETLNLPATEVEKQQFLNSENPGVVQLISTLKSNNQKLAEHHSAAAEYISNTTMVELKDLKAELKKLLKEIKANHSNLNMRFAKARETSKTSYKKLARTIAEIIDINQIEGEDPWIVHHSFQRQLKRDLTEDAAYQEKIKESVVDVKSFEDTVMVKFKTILNGYYTWRSGDVASTQDDFNSVKDIVEQIPNDGEWNAFLERYPNQLKGITSEAHPTDSVDQTLSSLDYPLKSHPYVDASLSSTLQRRSGVGPFKSWKEQHLVLTATGFLYGFPDNNIMEHKEPDFGLQLKKCQLVTGKKDFDFEVTGKSLGGGIFNTEKHYQFRTNSPDERMQWIEALQKWGTVVGSPISETFGAAAKAPLSEPSTTEPKNAPAEPVANVPQEPEPTPAPAPTPASNTDITPKESALASSTASVPQEASSGSIDKSPEPQVATSVPASSLPSGPISSGVAPSSVEKPVPSSEAPSYSTAPNSITSTKDAPLSLNPETSNGTMSSTSASHATNISHGPPMPQGKTS